jgi:hypothetical protein
VWGAVSLAAIGIGLTRIARCQTLRMSARRAEKQEDEQGQELAEDPQQSAPPDLEGDHQQCTADRRLPRCLIRGRRLPRRLIRGKMDRLVPIQKAQRFGKLHEDERDKE